MTAPVLSGLDAPTLAENTVNATPQIIDSDVTLTDAEGDLAWSLLTVSGLLAEDRVGIQASGPITVDGAGRLYYNGDWVGVFGGGQGDMFSVQFMAGATTAIVEAVIEHLTYANVSDTPTANRDLVINVTDFAGEDLTVPGYRSHIWETSPFSTLHGSGPNIAYVAAGDLDGDGDQDILVAGPSNGPNYYFENIGTAQAPVFAERTGGDNPFSGFNLGTHPKIVFADLDADGDLDLIQGVFFGGVNYYRNDGTTHAPSFTLVSTPSGLTSTFGADIAFGDLDNDGDLDAVVAELTGPFRYFENTGSAAAPSFTERTDAANPLNGFTTGSAPAIELIDVDADGDLDLFIHTNGVRQGWLYRNDGTIGSPTFVSAGPGGGPLAGDTYFYTYTSTTGDFDGDGDIDLVYFSGDNVGGWVENTTVAGVVVGVTVTAQDEPILGDGGANTLAGTAAADVMDGAAGDDILDGGDGADELIGGDGNDYLKGGAGADEMFGGTGDDTYVVDSLGDTVDETGGDGVDTVISRVDWTLGAGLENLTIGNAAGDADGTGNALGNIITGNAGGNVLNGLGGADTLYGGGGHDTLYGDSGTDTLDGGNGNDLLYGGHENDVLTGGAGNDRLDGGSGADIMTGGAGNDTYVLDDGGDQVIEAPGGGIDTVESLYSIDISAMAEVENATLLGSYFAGVVGNGLNNVITGNAQVNSLYGGGGDDTLNGGGGDDWLSGEGGTDWMTGGAGADTFVFASGDNGDRITDLNFAEGDVVNAYALGISSFVNRFSKVPGQAMLTYSATGDLTYLRIDVNGDGKHDLQFALGGNHVDSTGNRHTGAGDTDGGWII